jgi:nucleoporin NUP82
MASNDDDWSSVLTDHPIFSLPKTFTGPVGQNSQRSLELSTATLPKFTEADPEEDGPTPSGRRQVMVLKDADLILAAGKEVRITSLGDSKLSRGQKKSYKVRRNGCFYRYKSTIYAALGSAYTKY